MHKIKIANSGGYAGTQPLPLSQTLHHQQDGPLLRLDSARPSLLREGVRMRHTQLRDARPRAGDSFAMTTGMRSLPGVG